MTDVGTGPIPTLGLTGRTSSQSIVQTTQPPQQRGEISRSEGDRADAGRAPVQIATPPVLARLFGVYILRR